MVSELGSKGQDTRFYFYLYILCVIFFIPLVLMSFAYSRMTVTLWRSIRIQKKLQNNTSVSSVDLIVLVKFKYKLRMFTVQRRFCTFCVILKHFFLYVGCRKSDIKRANSSNTDSGRMQVREISAKADTDIKFAITKNNRLDFSLNIYQT